MTRTLTADLDAKRQDDEPEDVVDAPTDDIPAEMTEDDIYDFANEHGLE